MVKWQDRHGQSWTVLFTFGTLDRVKAETGVDLSAAMEDQGVLGAVLFGRFGRKLVEVLYVVCEAEARERGVEPEQWADLFDGATIERASTGLMEGIADFFPRTRVGKAIRENLPKLLREMDDDLIRKLKLPNPAGLKGSAGNSPGSAA